MVARFEMEIRDGPPPSYFDGVLLGETIGCRLVGQIGDLNP